MQAALDDVSAKFIGRADLYYADRRLVIEDDGGSHEQPQLKSGEPDRFGASYADCPTYPAHSGHNRCEIPDYPKERRS